MARFGNISEEVNGNLKFLGRTTFAQGVAGYGLQMKKDTQIWYVDSGKTGPAASGNGENWDEAFLTLAEAVAVAGNYDVILIAENSIQTIAATGIVITQTGLKIFGANACEGIQAAALKCTGTAPMFIVAADRVEIAYLNLSQRGAYPCIQIGTDAQSIAAAGIYQTYIHHCNFDGYGIATYGVCPNQTGTVDTVNLVVEDCYFKGHITASIVCNGTRESHRRNTISVLADSIGFDVRKTGGSREYTVISDNLLFGVSGSTTCGIKTAGNITAGLAIWARNLLSGSWNTTIGNSTGDHGVLNYAGSTTGGTLIDCNNSA